MQGPRSSSKGVEEFAETPNEPEEVPEEPMMGPDDLVRESDLFADGEFPWWEN